MAASGEKLEETNVAIGKDWLVRRSHHESDCGVEFSVTGPSN